MPRETGGWRRTPGTAGHHLPVPWLQPQHAGRTTLPNESLRGLRTARWQRLRVQGVRELALLWLHQRREHDSGGRC